MIVRYYITCSTCGQQHLLRIQLGASSRQEHSFQCVQCKQTIQVALDLDQKNAGWQFHALDNARLSDIEEGTPVYLSPDFVANGDHIHDETYFGSFDFMRSLMGSSVGQNLMSLTPTKESYPVAEVWTAIERIWRLEDARQYALSGPLNIEFALKHGLTQHTFRENLWAFLNDIFSVDPSLRSQLATAIKGNDSEFRRFLHFYQTNLRQHHRRSELTILTEYFDSFNEHRQVFAYVRTGAPLPKSAKATSTDFQTVKSFYAHAFEFFASQLCILTCLNNILDGRKFDQLKNIALAKYLETDKAKRPQSIANNNEFAMFIKEFDSNIRNASAHNWFFLKQDNATIEYRSGGTGALNELSYTDYLYKCGNLMRQICNLMILELELDQIACDLAVVSR